MKKLTTLFSLFGLLVLTLSMSECANKTFTKSPPFTVGEITAQKWMAGVAQGGSGINIIVPITNLEAGVDIDSIYYMGHKVGLNTKPGDETLFVGHIYFKPKADMNMSDQDQGEYANPVPELGNNTKFKLKDDQVVIEYLFNQKYYWTKLNGVKKLEQQNYPSMPNPDSDN